MGDLPAGSSTDYEVAPEPPGYTPSLSLLMGAA
jgi:hypothetical protein